MATAIIYRALLVAFLISLCFAACPSNCSGKGACVSDACVCNIGFSGEDCSFESYRNFTALRFNGTQRIDLIIKQWGGDTEFVYPVFRIDLNARIPYHHNASIWHISGGADPMDIVSVTMNSEGFVTFRSQFFREELGNLTSTVPLPVGEWFSLTIFCKGTFDRNFASPTSDGWILLNGVEVGRVTNQLVIPRRTPRENQFFGQNFTGDVNVFHSWNYIQSTPTIGTCVTTKTNRITHDCEFDTFNAAACGTVPSDIEVINDPSALLDRFDIDLYVWSSSKQQAWYFPVHQESAQDALVNTSVQRGMKRLYVNNYCVTPAPGTCFADQTGSRIRRWDPKSLTLLLKKAHAAGIKVFALYTDVGPIQDVGVHNDRAKNGTKIDGIAVEPFDGIAMDYEPALGEEGANSLRSCLNETKALASRLNIPVHVSISWAWSGKEYSSTPGHEYVLASLGEGDSVDIQAGNKEHCTYESRTRAIIQHAKSKGMRAYITLETRSDFSAYSFGAAGEDAMWREIRNSFLVDDVSTRPNGYVLHHYRESVNTQNTTTWSEVGMASNCSGASYDFKGVCSLVAKENECGDGFCDPVRNETVSNCPQDCPNTDCEKTTSRSVCESFYSVFEYPTVAETSQSTTVSVSVLPSSTTLSPSGSERIVFSFILAVFSLIIVSF